MYLYILFQECETALQSQFWSGSGQLGSWLVVGWLGSWVLGSQGGQSSGQSGTWSGSGMTPCL